MKSFAMIAMMGLALVGCSQSPAEQVAKETGATVEQAQQALDAVAAREARINAARQQDPALDWARFSITTSKYSEWTSSGVYKTHAECVAAADKTSNECIPIPALPQSYWDAENVQ